MAGLVPVDIYAEMCAYLQERDWISLAGTGKGPWLRAGRIYGTREAIAIECGLPGDAEDWKPPRLSR